MDRSSRRAIKRYSLCVTFLSVICLPKGGFFDWNGGSKLHRFATILLVVISSSCIAEANTIYTIEGQITGGMSLFPPALFFLDDDGILQPILPFPEPTDYGVPSGGYPVDYTAQLEISNTGGWSFDFFVRDEADQRHYSVAWREQSVWTNVVATTHETAIIDFDGWYDRFDIDLDLLNETGAWSWSEHCPECFNIFDLPSATATVTSIEIVPETVASPIALLCIFAFGTSRTTRSVLQCPPR
jgi:hypothetical protein